MIRMQQIKLPIEADEAQLRRKVCRLLKVRDSQIKRLTIRRRSLDARKKPELYYVYTVDAELDQESRLASKVDGKNIMFTNEKSYVFQEAGTEQLP